MMELSGESTAAPKRIQTWRKGVWEKDRLGVLWGEGLGQGEGSHTPAGLCMV